MKDFSAYTFSFFRILMGLYLALHFAMLIPYGPDIWGGNGMLPDPALNPTYGILPNPLNSLDSPWAIRAVLTALMALSLAFAAGFARRSSAALLWLGWVFLFNRNNLISNPSIPYVGWLLLATLIVPPGEPLSLNLGRKSGSGGPWVLPKSLFYGAWILLGLGYTLSGIDKLGSPSWVDGSAMRHLLENPLARDWFLRDALLSGPPELLRIKTWVVLSLELSFGPLCLVPALRKWAWAAMVAMHLGILSVVSFADLTGGMLLIHAFTFDPRWFPAKADEKAKADPANGPIIFFDGVCGLCNAFIDFVMREDRGKAYRFAALQGETAAERLGSNQGDLRTVMLAEGPILFQKSDAALRIIAGMGGIWAVARLLLILPKGIRNRGYDFVAANRYKWFGKKDACRMPTPEERARFLP